MAREERKGSTGAMGKSRAVGKKEGFVRCHGKEENWKQSRRGCCQMPRRREKWSETREEGGVVRCHGRERSVEAKGRRGGSMVGV